MGHVLTVDGDPGDTPALTKLQPAALRPCEQTVGMWEMGRSTEQGGGLQQRLHRQGGKRVSSGTSRNTWKYFEGSSLPATKYDEIHAIKI